MSNYSAGATPWGSDLTTATYSANGTAIDGTTYTVNGTSAAARTINLDFGDGETTQITTTNYTNDTNSDGMYYDLQGRKVTKPALRATLSPSGLRKGLYIVNGRKVVIK